MPKPEELDGAKVLLSTQNLNTNDYGYVRYEMEDGTYKDVTIAALAIAQYDNDIRCYLFSCDFQWEVIGDTLHDSLGEAIQHAEYNFNVKKVDWM